MNDLTILAFKQGYRIDNEGNVISPKGKVINSFRNGTNAKPYLCFSIRDKRNYKYAKKVYVHKLQAYQKYGNRLFKPGILVRHLDGNSENNSLENIVIGTHRENSLDIPKEKRITSSINSSRKMQNITRSKEERECIYLQLHKNEPYKVISENFNISKGTLSYMKNKSLEYREFISSLN